MTTPEKSNITPDASQFLSGDLTEQYLNDAEMDSVVGGASLRAVGTVEAKSQTTLGCWEDCTVSISGCKKLTT